MTVKGGCWRALVMKMIERQFCGPLVRVLLASYKMAGRGINLTAFVMEVGLFAQFVIEM